MRSSVFLLGILTASLALNGCGGSGSSSSDGKAGGTAFTEFVANLPDGSPMEIEILDNADGIWAGEFAVAAETGPYAHQVGSFEGKVAGSTLTATCELSDGTEFTLSGTAHGGKSMTLTRSDIPGTPLTFLPVTPMAAAATRAEASFLLTTGGTNGRVVINTSPVSVQGGGVMTEYRGSWQGVPVTFWQYTSGYAAYVIYVDPLCIIQANFSDHKFSNYGTATTTGTGTMTTYSTTVKAQIKVKYTPVASP